MKRWKSKFLLGAVLVTTAVSVNAKAINLSNTTTADSVDGRSVTSTYAGSFAQKSYRDAYQVKNVDSPVQGDPADAPRERSNATVSDADLWLMMVVGMGLVLVQLRRKQKLLSQQTLESHIWRDKAVS